MKKETLEEAKKYAELSYYGHEIDAFVRGAKWQQEQDKKLYSEEEVKKITEQTIEKFYKHIYADKTKAEMKELWFEQVKKKQKKED